VARLSLPPRLKFSSRRSVAFQFFSRHNRPVPFHDASRIQDEIENPENWSAPFAHK